MKSRARYAFLVLIPLGCATGENSLPGGDNVGPGTAGSAGDSAGGSDSASGSSSVIPTAGSATNASGGSAAGNEAGGTTTTTTIAGSFSTAGTFGTAGSFAAAGTGGTTAGTGSGGAAGSASAGKSAGGNAGSGTAGTNSGTAGTGVVVVGPYCDSAGVTKSALPYMVNDGFQPSGWRGDITAISTPTVAPDPCTQRVAGAVGICTPWRFTPNAVAPAWSGVAWSRVFDMNFTHAPVCVAAGATKVTFQARGAAGGEVVTFSAAGAAELPFTLTNAWKEYSIPLTGVTYNSADDGVDSGFFWKVAPPTPGGGAVTFFIDDIQFVK